MIRLEQFVDAHPGFEFPTHFCLAGRMGRSVVCFHNYYEQIFRDNEIPVDLHVFGFDSAGTQVGTLTAKVESGQAIQLPCGELGMREPGLIAVAALPRSDLQQLAQGRIRIRRRVGTGFYVIWEDHRGHVDTMHEWLSATPSALAQQTFYVVFHQGSRRIARHGLVLMNPVLDRNAQAIPHLSVYNRLGSILASTRLPPLPGMASRITYLDEIFPTFTDLLVREDVLGVRVQASNLTEPFSLELHPSGDFHLHHIN